MVMRRISRKARANIDWVWSGGRQTNGFGRQHIHIFAVFERHLQVEQIRNEFRDAIKAIKSPERYDFQVTDQSVKGCPTQADADRALGYVIGTDRNPIVANAWIKTFRSSGEFKRAKRTEPRRLV